MHKKLLAGLLAVAVGAAVVACADGSPPSPLAPGPTDVAALAAKAPKPAAGAKTQVNGLRWKTPLAADVAAQATIGTEGGTVAIPSLGVTLVVPPGAVQQPTPFEVRAVAGRLVALHFEPSGTNFPVPLVLRQSADALDRASFPRSPVTPLELGYFASDADLDQANGAAAVTEVRPALALNLGREVAFPVWHFSGYIVSWGRR
jgi:hypothetical protein